jgi:hypothetical protein
MKKLLLIFSFMSCVCFAYSHETQANEKMAPGSTVILRNGGKINMASGKDFDAPNGVTVNLESGEIQ